MDAFEECSISLMRWATEIGYMRGMSVAAALARKADNHELANRISIMAFEVELAHVANPDERETGAA